MVDPHPERVVHVLTVQQDDPDVRARLERYRALLSDDECARESASTSTRTRSGS